MERATSSSKKILIVWSSMLILFSISFFQSCRKASEVSPADEPVLAQKGNSHNPHNPPPPPPPQFYFANCNNPVYSATFVKGVATNTAIVKNYVNSPGGSYPAFTSSTVNGITITAPAGTFNVGSGSVTFTATGTPTATGFYLVQIAVGNIQPCMMYFKVANAPASGPNVDPGTTTGSTGVINFIYKGQSVAYQTVRAADGRIWLQQNLGSPQVAFHEMDEDSYGDYFQWGRWDDGHQSLYSSTITGGPSLANPSSIPSGNPNFIKGTTAGTKWWSAGGVASDTWSGTTVSSTNGKDPCAALGTGWRMPTAAEWQNVSIAEDLFGTIAAYQSNLKLPSSGYRLYDGGMFLNGDIGYYWSGDADANSYAKVFFFDNNYNAGVTTAERGNGFSCRCIKN